METYGATADLAACSDIETAMIGKIVQVLYTNRFERGHAIRGGAR
jgi:hypothetical protein